MAQDQTKRGGGGGEDDDLAGDGAGQERREKLAAETDDLLDEIDDVKDLAWDCVICVVAMHERQLVCF